MKKWKKVLAAVGIFMCFAALPVYGEEASGTSVVAGGAAAKLEKSQMKTSQLDAFQYFLYTPKNAAENLPLVVYLHGHNTAYMTNLQDDGIFVGLREGASRKEPAYILAPFLPPELDLGAKGMWPGIEPSIMELIEQVVTSCNIDRSRIYFVGGSMGADSAVQIVAAHPDTFAGLAGIVPFHYLSPMRKWETGWGEQFQTVPTWFIIEDDKDAKDMAQTAVDEINAAGGQAWVNVLEGKDHGQATSYVKANQMPEIYNWLLSIGK